MFLHYNNEQNYTYTFPKEKNISLILRYSMIQLAAVKLWMHLPFKPHCWQILPT